MRSESNRVMSSRDGGRGFKKKKAGSVLEKEPLQAPWRWHSCPESSDSARPDSQPRGFRSELPRPVGVHDYGEGKTLETQPWPDQGLLKPHPAFSLSQLALPIQPLFQSPELPLCPISWAKRITVPSLPLVLRTGAVHESSSLFRYFLAPI